jgi:PTS system nitrogen regulatory IIA component
VTTVLLNPRSNDLREMRIQDLLSKKLIIEHLSSRDKLGVISELVNHLTLQEQGQGLDAREILRVLLERENLGSTGIGEGVAIPHGKMKDLKNFFILFGRSREGADFQSLDNKPAHLFFLLLAPEDSATTHLKVLARISRLLMDAGFRKSLMEAPSASEIYSIIVQEDNKYS